MTGLDDVLVLLPAKSTPFADSPSGAIDSSGTFIAFGIASALQARPDNNNVKAVNTNKLL